MQPILTPELLLEAYKQGLFPMAYSADSPYIQWVCPEWRGQLSIEGMHISRSLRKAVKRSNFEIRVDTDFEGVITACGEATDGRPETWINDGIIEAFCELHARGHAHSIECWDASGNQLVGGLYGMSIGGAFFGESMFSRATNASKIALVHLVARLWRGGFKLLDTQFTNEHLEQFGIYEIAHSDYLTQLLDICALESSDFMLTGKDLSEQSLITDYFKYRNY